VKSKSGGPTPPPLPASIEALLKHERELVPQPEAQRARVLSRAREAVRNAPPLPSARPALEHGSRSLLGAVAALAVAGGVAGSLYFASGTTPSPSPSAAPSASVSAAPPAATHSEVSPAGSPEAADAAAEARTPTAAPALESPAPIPRAQKSPREERAGELQLLVRARQASALGDSLAVLALADEHERTYPAGRLAEEREVLRVKALVALGRLEQARRAGAKFHRRFPRSVLLKKIDQMLASAP